MRKQRKSFTNKLLILSIVFSLFLCQLTNGDFSRLQLAKAGAQAINTLPPMTVTFDAPIGTQIPTISPFPTLGPGQYFDENDIERPEVDLIEEGNKQFGYGPVSGTNDLYAIWITDEAGTHYLIVHKDSELLRGDIDPVTEDRINNGFDHMLDPWTKISNDIDDKLGDVNEQQESRMSSHGTALGIAGVGGFFCVVLSGGGCLLVVGLASLTFWGDGVHHNGLRQAEIARLEELQKDLVDEEIRLMGKFEIGKSNTEKSQQPIQLQQEGGEANEGS